MAKWWCCGVALAIAVVSLSVIAGVTAKKTDVSVSEKTAVTTSAQLFGTFGVYEGKLAFFSGATTPETVYDVWVGALPAAEQDKLEAGIPVADRAAYRALLQEYTG